MIIKSHIRGGYRSAAAYLKAPGQNEKIRTVEISDPDASNLDEAFQNMWAVASRSRSKKPLHHISINPYKDERLTDAQVLKIIERCEQKYGYKPNDHQRVIVEHIKDGRQHFHIIWNRVSLTTGKAVWPGHHWNKSKQVAREMEKELGLKCPVPKRMKRARASVAQAGRAPKRSGRYSGLHKTKTDRPLKPIRPRISPYSLPPRQMFQPSFWAMARRRYKKDENKPGSPKRPFHNPEWESTELLIWAWQHHRIDILAQFGIYLPSDAFDP